MGNPRFNVSISTDERTGRVMAVYFRLRQGEVDDTREILEGKAFGDYDQDGLLLGVELLAPCEVDVLDRIFGQEPEGVRQFVRQVSPRAMLVG